MALLSSGYRFFKNGDPPSSGNCSQGCITHLGKEFLLMSNWKLWSSSLGLLPLITTSSPKKSFLETVLSPGARLTPAMSLEDLFTMYKYSWVFFYSLSLTFLGGHCEWNGRTGCWQHLPRARARQSRPCKAPGVLSSIQVPSAHCLCSVKLHSYPQFPTSQSSLGFTTVRNG